MNASEQLVETQRWLRYAREDLEAAETSTAAGRSSSHLLACSASVRESVKSCTGFSLLVFGKHLSVDP